MTSPSAWSQSSRSCPGSQPRCSNNSYARWRMTSSVNSREPAFETWETSFFCFDIMHLLNGHLVYCTPTNGEIYHYAKSSTHGISVPVVTNRCDSGETPLRSVRIYASQQRQRSTKPVALIFRHQKPDRRHCQTGGAAHTVLRWFRRTALGRVRIES